MSFQVTKGKCFARSSLRICELSLRCIILKTVFYRKNFIRNAFLGVKQRIEKNVLSLIKERLLEEKCPLQQLDVTKSASLHLASKKALFKGYN